MSARPLAPGLRRLLIAYCGLGVLTGIPLFLGTEHTDRYFAWTIKPPLTAAFLGAGYWGSALLNMLAARERTWAQARVAVPAGLVFTSLMLGATLLHLDPFHFHSSVRTAQAVTWIWLIVYVLVPSLMVVLVVPQLRVRGNDPPRMLLLPGSMRLALVVQGLVMLGVSEFWQMVIKGAVIVLAVAVDQLQARMQAKFLPILLANSSEALD